MKHNAPHDTNDDKGSKSRKKFTKEEDMQLIHLVSIFGSNNWSAVAKSMRGRTTRQCRERYKTYLSPGINQAPWSADEDTQLILLYQTMGPKWAEIAKYFNGRSDNNVKNRWYTHLKQFSDQNITSIPINSISPVEIDFNNVNVKNEVSDDIFSFDFPEEISDIFALDSSII